jgi:S-adenosylmethionine synthetase
MAALANDSSIGCGFAPLTPNERLVSEIERYLTDGATLAARPYLGEDVKVLAVRIDDAIELTVAAAFVAAHLPSLTAYLVARSEVEAVTCQLASRIGAPITEPQVVWLGVSGPGARDAAGLTAQVRDALERLPDMWRDLVAGGQPVV